MNGEANCILEICCPPSGVSADASVDPQAASANAVGALAKHLAQDLALDADMATAVSGWIYKHFDLAERGTLQAFKASVVRIYNTPRH